jgi:hypothetical protein
VRKTATPEADFEAEKLRFHYKMWWSNETALKKREKSNFEAVRETRPWLKSREFEEMWSFEPYPNAIPL